MKFVVLLTLVMGLTLLKEAEPTRRYRSSSPAIYIGPPRRKFSFMPQRSSYRQDSRSHSRLRPMVMVTRRRRPVQYGYVPRKRMPLYRERSHKPFRSRFTSMNSPSRLFVPSTPSIRFPMRFNSRNFISNAANMMNSVKKLIHPDLSNIMKEYSAFGSVNGLTGRIQKHGCPWNMITTSQLKLLVETVLEEYGSEEPYTLRSLSMVLIKYCEKCTRNGVCLPERHEITIQYSLAHTDGCTWDEKCSCKGSDDAKPISCFASGTIPYGAQQVTKLNIECDGKLLTRNDEKAEPAKEEEGEDSEDTTSTVSNEGENLETTTPATTPQEEDTTVTHEVERTTEKPEEGSGDSAATLDSYDSENNELAGGLKDKDDGINGESILQVEKIPPHLNEVVLEDEKLLNL